MPTTNKKQRSKIAHKKAQMRAKLWPDVADGALWLRANTDGWLSIPRAMPLIQRIMDTLAPKGKPVSATYLDLWCRTFNDAFLVVTNPREMAYYSGFSGERAEHTWTTRVNILRDLGFIDTRSGVTPINYVLIFNPYHVIKRHHASGDVNEASYNALQQRMLEIGAHDLDDPIPTEAP